MRIIDLNKHITEYIKIFGKKNVTEHVNKLFSNFNNKKGEKTDALGKKKT